MKTVRSMTATWQRRLSLALVFACSLAFVQGCSNETPTAPAKVDVPKDGKPVIPKKDRLPKA
jgi:hypothetical protein